MNKYQFAVISAVVEVDNGRLEPTIDKLEKWLVDCYGLTPGASAFEAACDVQIKLGNNK